jgi:outer membrane immunogenic protein
MRSRMILSAALAVGAMFGIGSASAADMAMKAAPVAVAPAFSWTGCYVGVHGGAGVLLDQGFFGGGLNDKHGIGGLAGGQIGCNYQTGMLVLGIEGEGFWSGMKVDSTFFSGNNLPFQTTSIKNRYDYDIAARFGIAVDRALVYGKAGWVAGRFDWTSNTVNFCGAFCSVTTGSATLDGLLVGIGLEYAFTRNWTAKFEYDYLGFGSKNVNFVTVFPTGPNNNQIQNVSADKHIFKVGVNYLFNAGPVVARY